MDEEIKFKNMANAANAAIVDHMRKMIVEISRKKIDQEDASIELKFMSSVIVVDDLTNIIRAKYTDKKLNETQLSEIFNAARQFIAAIDGALALEKEE